MSRWGRCAGDGGWARGSSSTAAASAVVACPSVSFLKMDITAPCLLEVSWGLNQADKYQVLRKVPGTEQAPWRPAESGSPRATAQHTSSTCLLPLLQQQAALGLHTAPWGIWKGRSSGLERGPVWHALGETLRGEASGSGHWSHYQEGWMLSLGMGWVSKRWVRCLESRLLKSKATPSTQSLLHWLVPFLLLHHAVT
jgi:hypothetical protein